MSLKLLGNRIRDRRVYLGLKQQEVADAIGTSRSNYARYEAGDVDLNYTTLQALKKVLGVKNAYLIPDEIDEWSDDSPIESYYNGLPPDTQSLVAAMIRAAHDAARRAETTHGKKAE
jgi:transcriptional regulator with XRE-family HTH domain